MRSMRGINRLEQESFWCPTCNTEHTIDAVENNWRCPECDNHIHVHAVSSDGSENIAIIRKRASELKAGDLFLLPGKLDSDPYTVLGINQLKNELGVGLQGWGQYKMEPDKPVNCRIGRWCDT